MDISIQAIPVTEPVLDFREIKATPIGKIEMISECNYADTMRVYKIKETLLSHYKTDPPLFKLYAKDSNQSKANEKIIVSKPNCLPTNKQSDNLEKELDDLLS